MTKPVLPIQRMHERHHGLTQAIADTYVEAATVCVARHHSSPIVFSIQEPGAIQEAQLAWTQPDARTQAAWANDVDRTAAGAYGCALAATELARGLTAVRRAETGSGADYYVALPGLGVEDLEDCLRLEVSGLDSGGTAEVRRRVAMKVQQLRQGTGSLPAIAGVVGFKELAIVIEDVLEAR